MQGGRRIAPWPGLAEVRAYAPPASSSACPPPCGGSSRTQVSPVHIAPALERLAEEVDRQIRRVVSAGSSATSWRSSTSRTTSAGGVCWPCRAATMPRFYGEPDRRALYHVLLTQGLGATGHLSFGLVPSRPEAVPRRSARPMASRPSGRTTASRAPAAPSCIPVLRASRRARAQEGVPTGDRFLLDLFENDRKTPTGLAGYLRERGLARIFLAGLAFDFWSCRRRGRAPPGV